MPNTLPELDSLTSLLDTSSRPIYAIDEKRRIVYSNRALAEWLELPPDQIVGRIVEYHSEPTGDSAAGDAPLAELCPPPQALAGQACDGTISSMARGGGLLHRHAQFLPLGTAGETTSPQPASGVLVFVSGRNLSPLDLSHQISGKHSADELHRTIRQFRRTQADRFAIESLLGDSSTMRKLRAQVRAAASSGASALICGKCGSGRGHVARAIHYTAVGDAAAKLVPLDCEITNDDLLRRAIDTAGQSGGEASHRSTLLLENLDRLPGPHQSQLLAALRQNVFTARILATTGPNTSSAAAEASSNDDESPPAAIEPQLLDSISTITIQVPALADRLEDLPILTQVFLEHANRGSHKQVGSVRSDALDLLALHSWPGELVELREVITAAQRRCASHEITPADLPAVVHHASKSAARVRRPPERIVLDTLLAEIEREAIVRALAQTGGNKTEAAELLGMTRPRLYRRLLQLGLAGPEFIEQEPGGEAP